MESKKFKILVGFLLAIIALGLLFGLNFFLKQKTALSPISQPSILGRLSLSPNQGKFKVGEKFSVGIILESKDYPVNGTDVILNFDPTLLTIEEKGVQTTSVFPLYPRNWVNKEKGEVILTGLATAPAENPFGGPQTLGFLTFRGLKQGLAQVSIVHSQKEGSPSSTIIKAKGSENILSEVKGGTYEILP